MTTILTDGNYIIADKRVTTTLNLSSSTDKKEHLVYTDVQMKITPVKEVYYAGQAISCMAFSGDAGLITRIKDRVLVGNMASNKGEFQPKRSIDLNLVLDAISASISKSSEPRSVSMFALCQDSDTYWAFSCKEADGNSQIDAELRESGCISGIGSGLDLFSEINPYLIMPPHLIDLFMFCAHTDDQSSVIHDIYGKKEKVMIMNSRPTDEEVERSVNHVQSLLMFHRFGRKPAAVFTK